MVALRRAHAARQWRGAVDPDKPALPPPERISRENLLRLLEWVTLTVPAIAARGYSFLLLPVGPVPTSPLLTEFTLQCEEALLVEACMARDQRLPDTLTSHARRLIKDFQRKFLEHILARPSERDADFLREYHELLQTLTALANSGRPVRFILSELIGSRGCLTLGPYSCEFPRGWKTRCTWQESPSDWGEFLLAMKYGSNTRAIKERLARANREQQVAAAWTEYGRWLSQTPSALQEVEALLPGVQICPSSGHSETGPVSDPVKSPS